MAVGDHTFPVEVLTPEGEVFNGEVVQLSTRTLVGEVGILANHAPMLASLKPTELRLKISDSETKRYAQSHGMLQVYGNRAQVLVEQATAPGGPRHRGARVRDRRRRAAALRVRRRTAPPGAGQSRTATAPRRS